MKIFAMLLALVPTIVMAAPAKDTVMLNKDTIVLRGVVDGNSVDKISQALLQSEAEKITMFLSSPGGSVVDGLSLIQLMRASGKHFTCVTDYSASMSWVLFQACDDRVVMSNSVLMAHPMSFGVSPTTENQVDTFVGLSKSIGRAADEIAAAKLGISVAKYKADARDDLWLFGSQALKYRAADRVAPVLCDAATSKATYTEDVQVFIFKVKVTWSQCPLITNPLKVEAPMGFTPKAQEQFYKSFVNFRNAEGVIRQ